MNRVEFVLEKAPDSIGVMVPTLFRLTFEGDKEIDREVWCDVQDLDILFESATRRWGKDNWDLDKVCQAVRESEID